MSTAAIAIAMSSMALAESSSHGCSSSLSNVQIPDDIARVLVGLMLVAFVAGFIKGWQEDGFVGAVLFALLGPLLVLMAALIVFGVGAGVMFVLGVA